MMAVLKISIALTKKVSALLQWAPDKGILKEKT